MEIKQFAQKYGIPINEDTVDDITELVITEYEKISIVDYKHLLGKYITHITDVTSELIAIGTVSFAGSPMSIIEAEIIKELGRS